MRAELGEIPQVGESARADSRSLPAATYYRAEEDRHDPDNKAVINVAT